MIVAGLVHDPGQIRRRAGQLLSEPPYMQGEPGPLRAAWDQLVDLIGELLAGLAGTVVEVPGLAVLLVALGLVLLGLLAWRLSRQTSSARRSAVSTALSDPGGSSSADWARRSEDAEAAGDLAGALRARYLAAVRRLEERGLLEQRPGRTIRECTAEVAAWVPDAADALAASGHDVEEVTFGGRPATGDDLARASSALAVAVRADGAPAGVGGER